MDIKRLAARVFTSRLERFSNKHIGESCYVFGDGPSIKWFDLDQFADHPAICCGMIPFHKDFVKLRIKYATLAAPWVFLPKLLQPRMYHLLGGIASEYKRLVRNARHIEFFINLSNMPSLSGANVTHIYRGLPRERNFTDGLLRGFDLFAGSFHASLTLAYYLGFSKIYLVGFDAWTIQPSRNMHWYERGEGVFFEPVNLATDFLDVIRRSADIYTISADGQSKNVVNISYESYTGKKPLFRENDQLLAPHHLAVLATYPGYKIFPEHT